ncbi:hypothetical protein YTPLAS18_03810 [Nitrospira sp.]|nr:hypothetical protein YTPLAS18_03810 [Nitrospira sp.]
MRPSPPSAGFTVRADRRFPVACPVYYLGRGFLGKGLTLNVSMNGWRVKGDQVVQPGQWLAFRIQLPWDGAPVEIPRAIVRWVHEKTFGVEWLFAEDPAKEGLCGFSRDMATRL